MEISTTQVLIFQRAPVTTKWDMRSMLKVGLKGNAVKKMAKPSRHIHIGDISGTAQ